MHEMRDSRWKDWYLGRHESRCRASGNEFENYVSAALRHFHIGFVNPAPTGTLGDGGSDGLADEGRIVYACYGSRAQRDADKKLAAKADSDFSRALEIWPRFTMWRLVTNVPVGPTTSKWLVETQAAHNPTSARHINLEIWTPDHLWEQVVSKLTPDQLDLLHPGVPGNRNLDLLDLIPLLDLLTSGIPDVDIGAHVAQVPLTKMDFNEIPRNTRFEFDEGRIVHSRIETWFNEHADPDLKDQQGSRFREIYEEIARVTTDPKERIERVYTAIGGSDFRHDSRHANAVYAVTSYFFDSCHIFEAPDELGAESQQS